MSSSEIDSERYIVGRRAIVEAIDAQTPVEKIFLAFGNDDAGPIAQIRAAASRAGVQCSIMDRRKFQVLEKQLGLAPNDAQGVIAIRPVKDPVTLETLLKVAREASADPIVVVLDGITDPHNLGAIARSVEGSGAFGMILPIKFSAPVTPVAVKASAGALEHLPVAKVARVSEALKYCKSLGWRIIGTSIPATAVYTDDIYAGPIVIVIGNEGEGLHPSVQAVCDVLVEIPMMGNVASLNASVAAGIVLFEARSQRRSQNR